MVIACDVDEVLFPFISKLSSFHNEKYGTNLTTDSFPSFYFEEIWGGTQEEAVQKVVEFHHSGGADEGEALHGSLEAIRELSGRHQLEIVTSRQTSILEATHKWLTKHYPECFSDVHFANYWYEDQPKVTKVDICKAIEADLLIDDHFSYIEECAEKGVKGILFGDYPWNRNAPEHAFVRRAKNWPEVVSLINSGWGS